MELLYAARTPSLLKKLLRIARHDLQPVRGLEHEEGSVDITVASKGCYRYGTAMFKLIEKYESEKRICRTGCPGRGLIAAVSRKRGQGRCSAC